MAKKIVFFILLTILITLTFSVVEAKNPMTVGIPADFAAYKAAPGEIWLWEMGTPHPSLIRCFLGQQEGQWYPPIGGLTSKYASCAGKFDVSKYSVAIGGEPVTCDAGFNPAEMQINCKKMGK